MALVFFVLFKTVALDTFVVVAQGIHKAMAVRRKIGIDVGGWRGWLILRLGRHDGGKRRFWNVYGQGRFAICILGSIAIPATEKLLLDVLERFGHGRLKQEPEGETAATKCFEVIYDAR